MEFFGAQYPAAVVCLGLNYKRHAEECKLPHPEHPVVFYTNPSSVCFNGDTIVIPACAADPPEVDYECELGIVIGKDCKDVSPQDALKYVKGFTCVNDVSARKWQTKRGGGQWAYGKSFDTFLPVGPRLVLTEDIPDPQNLRIQTRLNGKTMQDSNTSDQIFPIADTISFLSQGATLRAGTLIITGTPEGVGFVRDPPVFLAEGDEVEIEIEHIGILKNKVRVEKKSS
eukprot:Hpha_TRINITY_DN16821_c1_g2::TRINITY_DN16821_c1_g2_i2::g.153762::m.153762